MTMKESEYLTLDGPSSIFALYSSGCMWCKYFNRDNYRCAAYRDVIPDKFLDGSAIHKTVEPGQEGNFVFTPKDQDIPPFLK